MSGPDRWQTVSLILFIKFFTQSSKGLSDFFTAMNAFLSQQTTKHIQIYLTSKECTKKLKSGA